MKSDLELQSRKALYKIRNKAIQFGLTLVLTVGLLSAFTIADKKDYKNSFAQKRGPASLEEDIKSYTASTVLSLDCKKSSYKVNSTQLVRIKGSACEKLVKGNKENSKNSIRSNPANLIASTTVKVEESGLAATVFIKQNEFTTDYLNLKEGVNSVLVNHKMKDGTFSESRILIDVSSNGSAL